MIRFLLRQLGLVIFAAGFVALVNDGIASIAAERLVVTSAAAALEAASLEAVEAALQRLGSAAAGVLALPASALLGGVGLLLMLIGMRPRARRSRIVT